MTTIEMDRSTASNGSDLPIRLMTVSEERLDTEYRRKAIIESPFFKGCSNVRGKNPGLLMTPVPANATPGVLKKYSDAIEAAERKLEQLFDEIDAAKKARTKSNTTAAKQVEQKKRKLLRNPPKGSNRGGKRGK
jgi:hypothetical protein